MENEFPVTALRFVLIDALDWVHFWEHCRNDANIAPKVAKKILGMWGYMRRFPAPSEAEDIKDFEELNLLVLNNIESLVGWWLSWSFLPENWISALDHLEKCIAYENTSAREENADEDHLDKVVKETGIRWLAQDLLDEVEWQTLALYAADALLPKDSLLRMNFKTMDKQLERAREKLTSKLHAFAPIASFIHWQVSAFRPDLNEFDSELYRLTAYCYAIKQWTEENRETYEDYRKRN